LIIFWKLKNSNKWICTLNLNFNPIFFILGYSPFWHIFINSFVYQNISKPDFMHYFGHIWQCILIKKNIIWQLLMPLSRFSNFYDLKIQLKNINSTPNKFWKISTYVEILKSFNFFTWYGTKSFKIINISWNIKITFYVVTSCGQSFNLFLNVVCSFKHYIKLDLYGQHKSVFFLHRHLMHTVWLANLYYWPHNSMKN
jgi:hypothetical protein